MASAASFQKPLNMRMTETPRKTKQQPKLPKVEKCPACGSSFFEEDICCYCGVCIGNSKDRYADNTVEPCCRCEEWKELAP